MGIILGLFLIGAVYAFVQSLVIEKRESEITDVHIPISTAALEMEINLIGTAFGLLGYLHHDDPLHLERIRDDESDFEFYQAAYRRLAQTPEATLLGDKVDAGYDRFRRLADKLIETETQQAQKMEALLLNLDLLDALLGDRIQVSLEAENPDDALKLRAAHEMEIKANGIAKGLGNFLRTHDPQYEQRVVDDEEDFNRFLALYMDQSLSDDERQWAEDIAGLFDDTVVLATEIIDLDLLKEVDLAAFVQVRRELDVVLDEEIQILARDGLRGAIDSVETLETTFNRVLFGLLAAGLVCGVFAAISINNSIVGSVRKLVSLTRQVTAGDLSQRADIKSGDELESLADSFNAMLTERQQADEQRGVLIAELEETNAELEGLYEISRIFSETGDFETKAAAALERLAVLAGADWVTLRLPKEEEPGLHLVAAAGPAVEEHPPLPVFTEAMTMSNAAFAEGRIMVIDDYASRPAASQSLVDQGMQSMVIMPVKTGDHTVGLVTVISKDKRHFNPELVNLLAAVGEGLGVLLENSMLHEESETANQTQRRMAVENAVMADIGRIISSSLDIHEVYEAFVAELAKLIDFEWVSVNLVDLKDQTVTVTYASRELIGHKSFPLVGTFTWAAASEPTGLVVDFGRGEDHPELGPFSEAGYRSIMGVRLVHHQVIGALILASASPGIFGDRELDIAERAARQIAGAIANAELYARQREADEEIRNLAKFPSENPNPVVRISADGIILYANDAGTKILENHGLNVGNSTLVFWQELVREAIASGTDQEVEMEYGSRVVSYSLVPVPEASYANIYGRDITAAKEVERLKDEFVSTVSHELRTPLTSIKGAAEILLNYRDEDPALQAEFLNIIDSQCDRLTRLLNDVLDLAMMESGQMQIRPSEVDLPSIIETAVDSTHSLTMQKNQTVVIALDDDLPTVASDPDRLIQVVTNLLSNAIKFTPKRGRIQVRSRLQPIPEPDFNTRMVEVSVSDNGVGIPVSEFENIFNRFQQVNTTLLDRPQGTGLGLPISKEIVELLGGEIWVESELGKGSTFFFTIPVEQSQEQVAGESDQRDKTTSPA